MISSNKSTEGKGNFKMYMGIVLMKVLCVNPNKNKLLSMGRNVTEEPNYSLQDNKGTRVDFYLETLDSEVKTKVSFFVNNNDITSKTGKNVWIDKYGKTTIYMDESSYNSNSFETTDSDGKTVKTFDKASARKCKEGEDLLTGFLKSLSRAKKDQECRLDTIDAIAKGDITELETLLENIPNNNIVCGLGIKDGKYYEVFNGKFLMGFSRDHTNLANAIQKKETEGYLKANFGVYPYNFVEFGGEEAMNSAPSTAGNLFKNIPTATDLPF